MTKKPLIAAAAVTAAAAFPVATIAANDASAAPAKPKVTDLDVDLVRGNTLLVTVEATRSATVKVTYRGTTRTAKLDRSDDGDDRERDFVARFKPAKGDGAGDRVSVKVKATRADRSTTRTLTDRIDDERRDDDGDDSGDDD